MAKVRDYKAEYARRIANAMAKGKTRQAARGHKVREHVERAQREREELGVTRQQLKSMFTFFERRSFEIHDSFDDPASMTEQAARSGFEWFKSYRKRWERMRRRYERDNRISGMQGDLAWLEREASIAGVPDISWLYYH